MSHSDGEHGVPRRKRAASAIEQHSPSITSPSSTPPRFTMANREMLRRATASRDRAHSTIETVTKATSPLMPGAGDGLEGDELKTSRGSRRAAGRWSHRRIHGVRACHTRYMHNPGEYKYSSRQ